MKDLEFLKKVIKEKEEMILDANDRIHGFAELPYEEYQSSALLCSILKKEGFEVEEGVAQMPTSFIGMFGSGRPVMGILGEFDALDILSQEAGCPVKKPVKEGAPGHGCGHCCLGTGALAAAIAVKEYLKEFEIPGTVIYYGCAAEEGAGSKQFMARAGLFDNTDFVYTWHPASKNTVSADSNNAIMGANFEFHGITAHAGGCPHLGRSALDAAELMGVGTNYLREHMIDEARVHYAYVDAGGEAPNVVQDHTLLKYEVRSPKVYQVKELFERVVNIAKGAALMTGTAMNYEITMAFSDYAPNHTLAKLAGSCLQEVGAPQWEEEDYVLAKEYLNSYDEGTLKNIKEELALAYGEERLEEIMEKPLDSEVHPFDPAHAHANKGSTDVGDVGYAVPTVNINVATACLGNVGHTWQMTGQAGSRIAHKGLLTAAQAIALSCIRTMGRPELIEQAKAETLRKNGGKYECPLPDSVNPPVGKY